MTCGELHRNVNEKFIVKSCFVLLRYECVTLTVASVKIMNEIKQSVQKLICFDINLLAQENVCNKSNIIKKE